MVWVNAATTNIYDIIIDKWAEIHIRNIRISRSGIQIRNRDTRV